MVTKIKPRRIKSDNPGSLGDFLGYQDEVTFQWGQGGGGETYIAGDGIAIISGPDYSAMRGPAPEGFHIPSKDEWVSLCGILTTTFSMASDATTMSTYLKMPMAGIREYSDAEVSGQGALAIYWSSTAYTVDSAYSLLFNSSTLAPQNGGYHSYGLPLRCFKDIPIIPTSSWTVLYDGTSISSGAGIFWDNTSGLISVSADGTNWTTIMDKNLGAISTDVSSIDSYGYYYQRGNNYGFATTGTVTTSSTKVDTTGYGPGNYFSDSTFIIGNGDWSTIQNDNLWGGVTGVVIRNNTITNTGVLSVNGQTGDIIVNSGDMFYDDFNFVTLTGSAISLGLSTKIAPSSNFTVNLPINIKDGQEYKLRVSNGSTPYTMTLGSGVENPWNVDLTLTQNAIDMFVFFAVGDKLELQPRIVTGGGGSATWGNIGGNIANQIDLQTALSLKANDGAVVHNTGNETVAGTKTFSTSPVVPSKTTDATNIGTVIATEAQVYKKQDKLTQGTGISMSNNTISNTGVLSINSNTGAINLKTINNTSIIGTGDIVTPITTVEDNLTSTSTTNALSANQGRILDGKIADLMALGKFLSLWNAATGQPISFPYTTPYAYSTGDYFLVEVVDVTTNHRPDGSSYIGTASSTVETDELEQGDVYIYDGTIWLLQSNHGKTVSFANITGQPTDNTNLATALGGKQDILTQGAGISISSNTVSNTGVLSVNGNAGAVTIEEGITKIFNLSGDIDTTTAQAIVDWIEDDGVAIVENNGIYYTLTKKATQLGVTTYYFEGNLSTPNNNTINLLEIATHLGTVQLIELTTSSIGGIQNDTTGTTTTVTKIRAGTEAEYNALSTHDANTIYHIY